MKRNAKCNPEDETGLYTRNKIKIANQYCCFKAPEIALI